MYSTLDYKFFIQLSSTLTKLCHTERDHPSNFTRTQLLSFLTEQMASLLTSCHIQHVCWHYKSRRSGMTCHRQRSTKLSTTFANVGMRAFRPMVDILSILR